MGGGGTGIEINCEVKSKFGGNGGCGGGTGCGDRLEFGEEIGSGCGGGMDSREIFEFGEEIGVGD